MAENRIFVNDVWLDKRKKVMRIDFIAINENN